jgi:hypothetical protein
MKTYRFIGHPNDYNVKDEFGYNIYKNAKLFENTTPTGWGETVGWHVERFPEDWEEVLDSEFTNLVMTDEEADKFIEERIEAIKKSLLIKAKEYVRNSDRMHNFNAGSQKTGKTREECLAGFRLKHEISVDDMRNDIKLGIFPSQETVKEKFGDIINYFILEEMSILHKIKHSKV